MQSEELHARKKFGNVSDYILFYTKSDNYVWNRPVEPWTESRAKEYQYVEPETGRRFMKVPSMRRASGMEKQASPGAACCRRPASIGSFPKHARRVDARGEIFWSANGNPRQKSVPRRE